MNFPAVESTLDCAVRVASAFNKRAACRSSHSGMPTDGSEFLLSKNRKSAYWILVQYEEDE